VRFPGPRLSSVFGFRGGKGVATGGGEGRGGRGKKKERGSPVFCPVSFCSPYSAEVDEEREWGRRKKKRAPPSLSTLTASTLARNGRGEREGRKKKGKRLLPLEYHPLLSLPSFLLCHSREVAAVRVEGKEGETERFLPLSKPVHRYVLIPPREE